MIEPTGSADLYKQQAYEATNSASTLQTSAPTLLNQLKENLMGIFTKDNPIIDARNDALSGYLSTAAQSRADVLPGNMPMVEGRPLALSPTQQNALTTSRLSASLAPLAGYNEILKGMYGNIGDVVQGAGDIYDNTIQSEQTRASSLIDLYRIAAQEEEAKRSAAAAAAPDPLLQSILALLGGGQQADGAGQPNMAAQGTPPPKKPSPDFVQRVESGGGRVTSSDGSYTFIGELNDWVPSVEEDGAMYQDTDTGTQYVYSGGQWQKQQQPGFLEKIFGLGGGAS